MAEAGERAGDGKPSRGATVIPTLAELGFTKSRASRWQIAERLRARPPGLIEQQHAQHLVAPEHRRGNVRWRNLGRADRIDPQLVENGRRKRLTGASGLAGSVGKRFVVSSVAVHPPIIGSTG
jgi:hypothetical protein